MSGKCFLMWPLSIICLFSTTFNRIHRHYIGCGSNCCFRPPRSLSYKWLSIFRFILLKEGIDFLCPTLSDQRQQQKQRKKATVIHQQQQQIAPIRLLTLILLTFLLSLWDWRVGKKMLVCYLSLRTDLYNSSKEKKKKKKKENCEAFYFTEFSMKELLLVHLFMYTYCKCILPLFTTLNDNRMQRGNFLFFP